MTIAKRLKQHLDAQGVHYATVAHPRTTTTMETAEETPVVETFDTAEETPVQESFDTAGESGVESSSDGSGSPEGWLWATIIAAAENSTAG